MNRQRTLSLPSILKGFDHASQRVGREPPLDQRLRVHAKLDTKTVLEPEFEVFGALEEVLHRVSQVPFEATPKL
jgi:hypothetical protein